MKNSSKISLEEIRAFYGEVANPIQGYMIRSDGSGKPHHFSQHIQRGPSYKAPSEIFHLIAREEGFL